MISVVINTLNEELNLGRALASVRELADEMVVCDLGSTDRTLEVARKYGAKIFHFKNPGYVEPARNFAIAKAKGDWILVLDPDEEISQSLSLSLRKIVKKPTADYYRLPRQNIIFGKWVRHSRWWPDYNIRFFKKGYVSWNEMIHAVPVTQGKGIELPAKENLAIIHHHYASLEEYLEKMNRYTSVQAEELLKNGYVFSWEDVIKKPLREFLSRFFAGQEYQDGVHGLALCLLQVFSEVVLYLKIWQKQGFKESYPTKSELKAEINQGIRELKWWLRKELSWLKFLK